jgi:hypothetical protein
VIRQVLLVGVLALGLVACGGDDGGGDAGTDGLVQVLRDRLDVAEEQADCIAEQVADADVDLDEVEAIVRGEGSEDLDAADAYSGATAECIDD